MSQIGSRRKYRSPRRRKTRGLGAWAWIALAMTLYATWPSIERVLRAADRYHVPELALTAVALFLAQRVRRFFARQRRIAELIISDRRADYFIEDQDYNRGGPKESAYRRVMELTLLAAFDNRCAKCARRDDGVDLDHFFVPKRAGGSFIMRHRDGGLVNNAIPLCVHCNRSKSARSYRAFFTSDELEIVLRKNQLMTQLLNERSPLDLTGRPKPRRRVDRAA